MGRSVPLFWLSWLTAIALGVPGVAAQPAPAEPPAPEAPPTQPPEPVAPVEPAPEAEPGWEREVHEAVAETSIDKEDRAPLAWHASLLWDHGYGAAGLFRGTGQTFNPTYAWDILLAGGYNFSRDTSFTAILPLALELTDSESTTTRQQLLLGDVGLDLAHTFLRHSPREGQTLKLTASGRLLLPSSLASQSASMLVGTRARLQARYVFERVLHGLLTRVDARYTRRWNSSATKELDQAFPCTTVAGDASDNCAHMGTASDRDAFLLGVGADLTFAEQWTLGLDLSFGWSRAHSLGDASVAIDSGTVAVGDTSRSHWRNSRVLELSVGYDFTPWFTLAALMTNSFSELSADGSYRAPLEPQDTAFGARLVFSFDQLYLSTQTHAGG